MTAAAARPAAAPAEVASHREVICARLAAWNRSSAQQEPGLRRAAVAVTLIDRNRAAQVLIVKRVKRGLNPGQWALPGGRVAPARTPSPQPCAVARGDGHGSPLRMSSDCSTTSSPPVATSSPPSSSRSRPTSRRAATPRKSSSSTRFGSPPTRTGRTACVKGRQQSASATATPPRPDHACPHRGHPVAIRRGRTSRTELPGLTPDRADVHNPLNPALPDPTHLTRN